MNGTVSLPLCWCALKHSFAVPLPLFHRFYSVINTVSNVSSASLKCQSVCLLVLDPEVKGSCFSYEVRMLLCRRGAALARRTWRVMCEPWLCSLFRPAEVHAVIETLSPISFWKFSSVFLDEAPLFVWPYNLKQESHLAEVFSLPPLYHLPCCLFFCVLSPLPVFCLCLALCCQARYLT